MVESTNQHILVEIVKPPHASRPWAFKNTALMTRITAKTTLAKTCRGNSGRKGPGEPKQLRQNPQLTIFLVETSVEIHGHFMPKNRTFTRN